MKRSDTYHRREIKETIRVCRDLPPFEWVRRKRQRNIRIRVESDRILISGPMHVCRSRFLEFAEDKYEWIRRSYEKQQRNKAELEKRREQNRGTLPLRGIRKTVQNIAVSGLRKSHLTESGDRILHRFNPDQQRTGSIWKNGPDETLIRSFYQNLAKIELTRRLEQWQRTLSVKPKKLVIRNQKTKWGSCSAKGTVSLNWRLILCPEPIMDYIIVHELCHLVHFNHGKAFWEMVSHYYPTVKEARKWIREQSGPIFSEF